MKKTTRLYEMFYELTDKLDAVTRADGIIGDVELSQELSRFSIEFGRQFPVNGEIQNCYPINGGFEFYGYGETLEFVDAVLWHSEPTGFTIEYSNIDKKLNDEYRVETEK